MNVLRVCVVLGAISLAACGSSRGDEGDDSESVAQTESAQRAACSVRCAEGYVLTKRCTCEPSSCTSIGLCVEGYTWSEARCRCVRSGGGGGGEACGSATCPASQVCCNASCGICTPPGDFCTQQVCE